MNKEILTFIALILLITGCTKTPQKILPAPVPNYFPVTAGSTWTYKDTNTNDTIVVKMTGETLVKNNITYYVASVTPAVLGNNKFYYSDNGKVCTMFTSLGELGVGKVDADFTIFDKIWAQGGHTGYSNHLTDSVPGVSMSSQSNVYQGYTKSTLNGITYDNVVVSGVYLQASLNGEVVLVKDYTFYVAPNVGIINESISYGTPYDVVNLQLVRSSIVP